MLTALNQDRDFFAKTHDECAYLIQTQMLARGKLWMPAHPLPDFFDSFYVLTTPKYASITFPGSAMFFVPALWLHLPTWIIPVIIIANIPARLLIKSLAQPLWLMSHLVIASLIVSVLARSFWRFALQHYSSASS